MRSVVIYLTETSRERVDAWLDSFAGASGVADEWYFSVNDSTVLYIAIYDDLERERESAIGARGVNEGACAGVAPGVSLPA